MTNIFKLPPLSLYIHIPWCIRKCPYCDFNSHAAEKPLPEAEYVRALLEDFKQDMHWIQGRKLHSIFFGGGTPSLFTADSINEILTGISNLAAFEPEIEITLEANPGTFETNKFSGFRQAGINRLSIGVQSFNNDHLKVLGRVHSGNEAKRAIETAINCGFDNYNLDLMHGLPGQTAMDALSDLSTAFLFQPAHLSWYQLTIESNTVFFSHPPRLPEENTLADIEEGGLSLLTEQGLRQYEVSAYSQPGRQSRHNLNYWQFGDYLGIGAGAHGKITLFDQQQIIRTRKTRQPNHYLDKSRNFLSEQTLVPENNIAGEFFINALRLSDGFNPDLLESRTGKNIDDYHDKIIQAQKRGLLTSGKSIQPTGKGRLFLNDLAAIFI